MLQNMQQVDGLWRRVHQQRREVHQAQRLRVPGVGRKDEGGPWEEETVVAKTQKDRESGRYVAFQAIQTRTAKGKTAWRIFFFVSTVVVVVVVVVSVA